MLFQWRRDVQADALPGGCLAPNGVQPTMETGSSWQRCHVMDLCILTCCVAVACWFVRGISPGSIDPYPAPVWTQALNGLFRGFNLTGPAVIARQFLILRRRETLTPAEWYWVVEPTAYALMWAFALLLPDAALIFAGGYFVVALGFSISAIVSSFLAQGGHSLAWTDGAGKISALIYVVNLVLFVTGLF